MGQREKWAPLYISRSRGGRLGREHRHKAQNGPVSVPTGQEMEGSGAGKQGAEGLRGTAAGRGWDGGAHRAFGSGTLASVPFQSPSTAPRKLKTING